MEFPPISGDQKGTDKIRQARQEQIYEILFNRRIDWQEIIYDLINTEQLDPWDVDIILLTEKYLERIKQLQEADFFISGKVLFAAALLLRIKSEVILNKYLKSIDEILFGEKDKKTKVSMESNPILNIGPEEIIPELVPKSPMPRFRRVTLKELMDSLNKAIITENRRIKKEIIKKDAIRETEFSLPKKKFSIGDRIKEIYERLFGHLKDEEKKKKISFTEFVGESREEKLGSFAPLIHLENQKKIWLQQEHHFDEIYIWLKDVYFKHNPDPYTDLKQELKEEIKEFDEEKNID